MNELTIEMVAEVIQSLPETFDSHDFIEKFVLHQEHIYKTLLTQYDIDAVQKTNMQLGRFLAENQARLHIMKLGKTHSGNFHGNETEVQVWTKSKTGSDGNGIHRMLFILLLVLSTQISMAQLNIIKPNLPSGYSYDDYPWDMVLMDYDTNTISPVSINENGGKVEITVFDADFSIKQHFTITTPAGYKDLEMCSLGYLGGRMDEPSFRLYLTRNLFTKNGLIEGVFECTDYSGNDVSLFINENNVVIGRYDGRIEGRLIDPMLVGGRVMFSSGVMVVTDDSGINSIREDMFHSSVRPNPSHGAMTVFISLEQEVPEDGNLMILDLGGKLVHCQMIKAHTRQIQLVTRQLPHGTYLYLVHSSNGCTSTGKLIID